jgi:hypothetical protein
VQRMGTGRAVLDPPHVQNGAVEVDLVPAQIAGLSGAQPVPEDRGRVPGTVAAPSDGAPVGRAVLPSLARRDARPCAFRRTLPWVFPGRKPATPWRAKISARLPEAANWKPRRLGGDAPFNSPRQGGCQFSPRRLGRNTHGCRDGVANLGRESETEAIPGLPAACAGFQCNATNDPVREMAILARGGRVATGRPDETPDTAV